MNRRNAIGLGACVSALALCPAWAQSSNTLSFVVPYPPGGASDVFARLVSPGLGKALQRNVIVENISGASGSIGAMKVLGARSPSDSLFMASPTDVVLAPLLLKSARYTPEDFVLLGILDKAPLTLFVRKDLSVNTVDEFIALAQRSRDKPLSFGTTGPGSFYHLVIESLQRSAGFTASHVPYRGGSPMMMDLIAGNIDFAMMAASTTFGGMAQSGKIKAIGVAGNARSARLPHVPAFSESKAAAGFSAPEMWAGVMAPRKTPPAELQRLQAALAEVLAQADVRKALETSAAGEVPAVGTLAESEAFYRSQTKMVQTMAQAAKFAPQ